MENEYVLFFEVPNLEYKGRLSVLYSSPETFVYLAALETRELRRVRPFPPSSPPLRPAAKPGFKTFATGRRNYKGGRLPPLSWIWELSAFVAIGFPPPAPASLILGICVRSHSQSRQPREPSRDCGGREAAVGGQAHPAPFPSGARPPAQDLPHPSAQPFPARFVPHPHPFRGALTSPRPSKSVFGS